MELIDAGWIKARLTQRHGELKALADATGMTSDKITKILKGERQIKSHEATRIAAFFAEKPVGFSEAAANFRSQVAPIDATDRMRALAAALCPDLIRPEIYRVKQSAPAAGIVAGDLLVVQLGMTAQPGDLVIATIADTTLDTQTSVIRRFWPPLLVPISPDDPYQALPVDDAGQTTAILASVKALARGGVAT